MHIPKHLVELYRDSDMENPIVGLIVGSIFGTCLGIGFGLTGFCPGTGLACAASGRIDALTAVIGMLFGARAYTLIYPSIIMPLEKIANFGRITLPQITGASAASWITPILATGSLALFMTGSKKPKNTKAKKQNINEDFFDSVSPIPIPKKRDSYIRKDYVRATRFIRRLKNLLFIVIMLCLLLLQTSFWIVNIGHIAPDQSTSTNAPTVLVNNEKQPDTVTKQNATIPKQLTGLIVEGPAKESKTLELFGFDITFKDITSVTNITNMILIFASVLYGLIMFCGIAASFGGGLGGLSLISRAFVYSLVMLILLLPWQFFFSCIVIGAIYTPRELIMWCATDMTDTFGTTLLYLRFAGYSTLVFILLIIAQFHSFLWSKAILSRFE